jgi:hypothetical protein
LHDRRCCLPEQLIFVIDAPAAGEELAHLDASFGVSLSTWPCRDVEDHLSQANRIIVATVA